MTDRMDFKNIRNEEGKVLVSVYGTLKQGWGNHTLLNKDPKFTGSIRIDTLDGVGFPIIKLGTRYNLNVEVYEVDEEELRRLDGLEGFSPDRSPSFYDRKLVDVALQDGSSIKTYVYEYVSDVANNIDKECDYDTTTGIYNWLGSSGRW